jgi:hypothetical protein
LIPRSFAPGESRLPVRVKTQEPRLTPPCEEVTSSHQASGKRQVGDSGVGTRCSLAGQSKLRRAKSQKRCECETKLTRAQREYTVKRVTKPWRRNVGRPGNLPASGPLSLTCAKGNESSREESLCCGKATRFNWVKLWRKAKLAEVGGGPRSRCPLRPAAWKTTKLRKWPTAQWDRQPIRRYSCGR